MSVSLSRNVFTAAFAALMFAGCAGVQSQSTLPPATNIAPEDRARPRSTSVPAVTPAPTATPTAAPKTPTTVVAAATPVPSAPPAATAAPSAAPLAVAVATPAPPATIVPTHAKNYAYWLGIEPATLTASWLAQHATFVEAPTWNMRPWKAAGGKYGVAYTDPNLVIVANQEPLWNTPESGWFHDASGARVLRTSGQNVLNPASSAAQAAYHNLTASLATNGYDFMRADDVYFDLLGVFWTAPAPGVEITTDTAYQTAEAAMFAQSALPVISSGFANLDGVQGTGKPSPTMTYLPRPNVAGGFIGDGCLQTQYALSEADWRSHENTLLAIAAAGKWAICHGMANTPVDSSVPRTFFLASWWLSYDPNWSVALPNFGNAGNLFVFPEYDLVPTQPVNGATTDIAVLKASGGAYVRQFSACYQAGVLIGSCAAVANPTTATVTVPAMQYTRALKLDANNSLNGGQATWTTGTPATLAPNTGAILAR